MELLSFAVEDCEKGSESRTKFCRGQSRVDVPLDDARFYMSATNPDVKASPAAKSSFSSKSQASKFHRNRQMNMRKWKAFALPPLISGCFGLCPSALAPRNLIRFEPFLLCSRNIAQPR